MYAWRQGTCQNVIADEVSRHMKDRSDWKLNPKVFDQINKQWGPFEIDLFASRLMLGKATGQMGGWGECMLARFPPPCMDLPLTF